MQDFLEVTVLEVGKSRGTDINMLYDQNHDFLKNEIK